MTPSISFAARLSRLFIAAVLTSIATTAIGQGQFNDVEIKATRVAGSVYMLEGAGGNIGVSVGRDGVLIVDSQFAPLADKIDKALAELDKGALKYLLNTHWHGDHTGGNEHFGARASIVAHANVRKRMAQADKPARSLPVITYDKSMSLHFNGEELKMVHLPAGHTDGDSLVFFTGSNVVHMGDQFFNKRFPYIDLSSGGSVEGYLKNIEIVLEKAPDDARIIPGHGPLATKEDLRGFRDMLKECIGIVTEAIAAGKAKEDIMLPSKYDDWGSGYINTGRWIQILYNDLS